MTEQEIFDRACSHFAEQKVQSVGAYGRCRYRGPEGRKCGAGIFLTDDEVWEFDADGDISGKPKTIRVLCNHIGRLQPYMSILQEIQNAHDKSPDINWLKVLLGQIATRRRLEPASIDAITEWNAA